MTEIETAWAAGIFDGEGYAQCRKGGGMRLEVTQTDPQLLDRLHKALGVGKVYGPYTRPGNDKVRPLWRWGVYNVEDVTAASVALLPYLSLVKQKQIEVMFAKRKETHREYNPGISHTTHRRYCVGTVR